MDPSRMRSRIAAVCLMTACLVLPGRALAQPSELDSLKTQLKEMREPMSPRKRSVPADQSKRW